ncbi:hypothetical protein FB451DRAFT_1365147, partial [Mycena latifolia]
MVNFNFNSNETSASTRISSLRLNFWRVGAARRAYSYVTATPRPALLLALATTGLPARQLLSLSAMGCRRRRGAGRTSWTSRKYTRATERSAGAASGAARRRGRVGDTIRRLHPRAPPAVARGLTGGYMGTLCGRLKRRLCVENKARAVREPVLRAAVRPGAAYHHEPSVSAGVQAPGMDAPHPHGRRTPGAGRCVSACPCAIPLPAARGPPRPAHVTARAANVQRAQLFVVVYRAQLLIEPRSGSADVRASPAPASLSALMQGSGAGVCWEVARLRASTPAPCGLAWLRLRAPRAARAREAVKARAPSTAVCGGAEPMETFRSYGIGVLRLARAGHSRLLLRRFLARNCMVLGRGGRNSRYLITHKRRSDSLTWFNCRHSFCSVVPPSAATADVILGLDWPAFFRDSLSTQESLSLLDSTLLLSFPRIRRLCLLSTMSPYSFRPARGHLLLVFRPPRLLSPKVSNLFPSPRPPQLYLFCSRRPLSAGWPLAASSGSRLATLKRELSPPLPSPIHFCLNRPPQDPCSPVRPFLLIPLSFAPLFLATSSSHVVNNEIEIDVVWRPALKRRP